MHDVTHEKREKRRKTPLSQQRKKLSVPGWIEKVLQVIRFPKVAAFSSCWLIPLHRAKQAECCSVNTPRHKPTQLPALSTSLRCSRLHLSHKQDASPAPSVCLPHTYLPTNPAGEATQMRPTGKKRTENTNRKTGIIPRSGAQEGSDASLEGNTDAWVDLKTGNTLQFTPRATYFHLGLSRKHS